LPSRQERREEHFSFVYSYWLVVTERHCKITKNYSVF